MDEELKLCPFCGGKARTDIDAKCAGHGETSIGHFVRCTKCGAKSRRFDERLDGRRGDCVLMAADAWNRRAPEIVKVETSFYDQEEVFHNCTVQVLTNTATGETSVGWWRNG